MAERRSENLGACQLWKENHRGVKIIRAQHYAGVDIGGFDAREGWPETPCFLRLYVEDADAVYHQAISVTEMTSLVWGDRGGRVRDPLGNIWWIQTRVEQVEQEEMAKRASEQPFRDALQYTRESLDREMRSRGR